MASEGTPNEGNIFSVDNLVQEETKDIRDIDRQNSVGKSRKMLDEQHLLKSIIESSGTMIAYLDTNYNFVIVNSAYAKESGYSIQQLIGKNHFDLFPNKENQAIFDKVRDTGEPVKFLDKALKFKYQPQTGVTYWDWTLSAVKNKKGIVHGLVLTLIETTERKKAEQTLEESNKRFRLVAEAANIMVYELDVDSLTVTVYRGDDVLGYKTGEIIPTYDWWLSQIHPDDRETIIRRTNEAIETGKDALLEYRIKTKQGDYITIHHTAKMVKDENGKVTSIVAGIKDVTERKNAMDAQKQLNEELESRVQERTKELTFERERLYKLIESLPVMVGLLTKDYHVAYSNKRFKDKFGDSKTRHCYDFIFGLKSPCEWCESYEVLKTGKPHYWRLNSPDGTVVDVYDSPFEDVDGSPMILEVDIDITEQIKLESQIKNTERLAAIGQTAGMVGHDIRNPLQAMISDVYLLKSELNSMPKFEKKDCVKESLDYMELNIAYVDKIVSDLQDYTRALKPHIETVNMGEIVRKIIADTVPDMISSQVIIKPADFVINSDATFLRRVITNLVVNAVQAMSQGGTLTLQALKDKNKVTICIKDTGTGIPEEAKANLFKPLYTTKAKGQGLGLAVVQRLVVEGLKGEVSFKSEEGKGTQFIVELPA